MIKGVHHFAISTRDIKKMIRFYCDVLGFELVMEMEWQAGTELGAACDRVIGLAGSSAKVAMASRNGLIIEFFEYGTPQPKPLPPDWKVCDHGYTHLCLEVEDLHAEYARLEAAGMTFHDSPAAKPEGGMWAIYGRDPEGHVIELLEILPAPAA